MLALAITPAPPRSMVVMPAVAVLMRPTVIRPRLLWSRYQLASVRTMSVSKPPVERAPTRELTAADDVPSSSTWLAGCERPPLSMAMVILKPADRFGLILAAPLRAKKVPPDITLSTTKASWPFTLLPSFQAMIIVDTWPEMVRLTRRLPLRAVVASSSATRSSRSAQQSPPRSAALADGTPTPPTNQPAAARIANLLVDFHSPRTVEYMRIGGCIMQLTCLWLRARLLERPFSACVT